jgi:hypothetical protein
VYLVRLDDIVRPQIAALPERLRVSFAEALTSLRTDPWSGEPYTVRRPTGSMRQVAFGPGGQGLIVYMILEDRRLVDLLKIIWLT